MDYTQITLANGKIIETVLGKAVGGYGSIIAGLRMHAARLYGKEGKDWRIVQAHDKRLVPVFARELEGLKSQIHVS